MRTKSYPDGQAGFTFTEAARRSQIIECAVETLATLGYAASSLSQIAERSGVSKSLITYYFQTKTELFEQVVSSILSEAAKFMGARVQLQPTAAGRLKAYLQTNVEYIGTHRQQMIAIREIVLNRRKDGGQLHYGVGADHVLRPLENLLRRGQEGGEFRDFNVRVMAVTIRGAIDALPRLIDVDPGLDVPAYGGELATLFERATAVEADASGR